jgi:hypothetical protein
LVLVGTIAGVCSIGGSAVNTPLSV